MLVMILDEAQYVKRRDGFTRIKEFAGIIRQGDVCKEILPESSDKFLALMFYREQLENIAAVMSEARGVEDPFKGDVFLMWMESGTKTANVLVAHSTEEGIQSIRCHLKVDSPREMSKCVRALLQLGDDTLNVRIPFQQTEVLLNGAQQNTLSVLQEERSTN